MSWTLCASSAAIIKAGVNANATIVADGTALAVFSTEAEGSIELETGKTYIANFSDLPVGIQGAVGDVCSSKVAMKIIAYDVTGYLSRESDTLLNVNYDLITKGIRDLKDYSKIKLKSPL